MSPEQKQRREAIVRADEENQYAVVELLSRFHVADFPTDAPIQLRRGRTLTMLSRYAEADEAFDLAKEKASAEWMPLVWTSKADSFTRRGRYLEAERAYLQADRLEPGQCWLLCLLAHATWRRGDLALAERRFRDALVTEGEERDEAFFNLGGVLVALDRLQEAADCYREALALSPDYQIAQIRLDDVEHALKLQQELSQGQQPA